MGMPCAHQIQAGIQEFGVLQLIDIHPHWPLDFHPQLALGPPVLEPVIVQAKGRPAAPISPVHRHPNRAALLRQSIIYTKRTICI